MSKLMQVLGIILLAAGIALAIMGLVNQAQLQVRGIDMASAINLIIGGILSIGLGGVISAVGSGLPRMDYASEEAAPAAVSEPQSAPAPEVIAAAEKPAEEAQAPRRSMRFPSFGRKLEEAGVPEAAATAAAAATVTEVAKAEPVTPAVKETIDALEQAKTDLENALTGTGDSVENMETVEAEAAAPTEGELFVVEDKVIRGHPARILSDGTVEAETDEGWMRFENLEHLDEYLDAVEQA